MKESDLAVFINKEEAGMLSYESSKYIFNYNEQNTQVVSLTMPIRSESWSSQKLHPIFEMNMPEGALREAIRNAFAKIEKMDDMGFLSVIGPYVLGRVKFGKVVKNEEILHLDEILHSPKENLFEELMDRFSIHSGVSGVQPKVLLSAQDKITMKFEHYIVKAWEDEYPQLALNEYFCMRAVVHAGLETPDFYLSEDLSLFVIKRFDIQQDAHYLGFEDMCVLTARSTEEKYDGSYEEIARVIKDIIPPENRREALKQLFKAMVMNHLLRNGDGHLKNYGVLYEHDFEDAKLAPIYDVVTTTMYIKKDIPALYLGENKLWWKEKSYRNFAKQSCGFTQREYEDMVITCEEAVKQTKIEMDAYLHTSQDVLRFIQDLKECWVDKL